FFFFFIFVFFFFFVRGLDYYARTVFEFTIGLDRLALNGGGRYDGLAEILGGEHTPGIGFGAGMERIVLELKKQGIVPPAEPPTRVFVVNISKSTELKNAVVQLVADLRHANIKAEMAYGDRSFKAQMKRAGSSNAEYVIVIGEDELAQNVVSVRRSGEESIKIAREDIVTYLLREDEK
ncbi:MAG TPA: histidine--tRNA ligase, partial [Ktedonobacter sp.]|nr:histidine--tRNA ligase [Ktedonobacter sp.]